MSDIEDSVYYVTISTTRRIPFINRRGPITSKIAMKESTITTLRTMGFDVKIISKVNLDKNGNQYADEASKFIPSDNQSESKVDVDIVNVNEPNEEIFSGETEGLEAKKDDLSHSQQEEETSDSDEVEENSEEETAEEQSTEETKSTEEDEDDFSLESYETYEKWNATKLKAYISDILIPRLPDEYVPNPLPVSKKDCLAFLKTLLEE